LSKRIVGFFAVCLVLAQLTGIIPVSAETTLESCPPGFSVAITIVPAPQDRNGDGIICIKSVPPLEEPALKLVIVDNNIRPKSKIPGP